MNNQNTFKSTLVNLIRPLINDRFKDDKTLDLFVTTAIECAAASKKRKSSPASKTKEEQQEQPAKKKITRRSPVIPDSERCLALTKNGKQCSKRRQENDTLCNIHLKYDDKKTTTKRIKKKVIPTTLSDIGLFTDEDEDDLFIVDN